MGRQSGDGRKRWYVFLLVGRIRWSRSFVGQTISMHAMPCFCIPKDICDIGWKICEKKQAFPHWLF